MYIYLVINTDNGKKSLIASHFPDLERDLVVRHKGYYVRIESKAMTPERALADEQLVTLPYLD